jgi:hypothetical protein
MDLSAFVKTPRPAYVRPIWIEMLNAVKVKSRGGVGVSVDPRDLFKDQWH